MLYTKSQACLDPERLGFLYSAQMNIGTRLRQLRTSRSLSQDKLGELCGVTKGMVSQWELNIVTPPTDRLLELHKHLEFSFDWLLNGEESASVYSTSDPTLVEILKVLQPRNEYLKTAAYKAVRTTVDLVDQAQEQTAHSSLKPVSTDTGQAEVHHPPKRPATAVTAGPPKSQRAKKPGQQEKEK